MQKQKAVQKTWLGNNQSKHVQEQVLKRDPVTPNHHHFES